MIFSIVNTFKLKATEARGGGGDSNMKMPGCVCQESENIAILNDTFGR